MNKYDVAIHGNLSDEKSLEVRQFEWAGVWRPYFINQWEY